MSRTPLGMFNKVAYRVTPTETRTAQGYLTKSWATSVTGFPCALQSVGSSDALLYGVEKSLQTRNLYCDTSVTLAFDDRVSVDSVIYRVIGPGRDEAGRGSHLAYTVERQS